MTIKMSISVEKRDEKLRALDRAMRQAGMQSALHMQAVADRLSLTRSDLECLDLVLSSPRTTAGDLAVASGLTTGAITGVLDRLEDAGLVTRQSDPEDRRRVLIRPQPAAIEKVAPLQAFARDRLQAEWDGLSEREIDFLTSFAEGYRHVMWEATQALGQRTQPRRRKPRPGDEDAPA